MATFGLPPPGQENRWQPNYYVKTLKIQKGQWVIIMDLKSLGDNDFFFSSLFG